MLFIVYLDFYLIKLLLFMEEWKWSKEEMERKKRLIKEEIWFVWGNVGKGFFLVLY